MSDLKRGHSLLAAQHPLTHRALASRLCLSRQHRVPGRLSHWRYTCDNQSNTRQCGGTRKWRVFRGPDEGGQAWATSFWAAVHIVEHRGVSGLGVSRTPRPSRTKASKTLTADDNNLIVMQGLGYESPSRESRAMCRLCMLDSREKFTPPMVRFDHPFGDGGSYRRNEPCLVYWNWARLLPTHN
ncbi:hypothetical protein F5883DRAFT_159663 [Diaporthe sp. PMI_573]|nr:hypothetical protein F5883DRAFT_159663 [Diaporthaceae sp. PMI_573]